MKKILTQLFWILLALGGAWAFATLALHRGESINSVYILIAALCTVVLLNLSRCVKVIVERGTVCYTLRPRNRMA